MGSQVILHLSVLVESDRIQGVLDAVKTYGEPRVGDVQRSDEGMTAGAFSVESKEPRPCRRVTRIPHKPKEGERLQDYVLKVLKGAKCPLTYREVGQLVKQEGYRGGMIRKIVSSCSPCLSNLAKQGVVRKIPKPDGGKGYVYELA